MVSDEATLKGRAKTAFIFLVKLLDCKIPYSVILAFPERNLGVLSVVWLVEDMGRQGIDALEKSVKMSG